MLRNTFIHLPGVGAHRERTLWKQGILDWDRFLEAAEGDLLRQGIYESAVPLVRQSLDAVAAGDAGFFHGRLPSREMWRLYPEFADRALFLDIETTGLSPDYNEVTVIGALGGGKLALFVKGINLDQFPAYVRQFPLLVTFNGSQFDVPFLRAHFPKARLDQAHIDLRFALASLGYRGGLKAVERTSGPPARPGDPGRGWFRGSTSLALLPARRPPSLAEADPLQPDGRGQHGRAGGDDGQAQATAVGVSRRDHSPRTFAARKFDAGSLGPWIEQTLSSWDRA